MMDKTGSIYLKLKLAAKLFSKPLEALAEDEMRRVRTVAAKQCEIEALILATPEAARVILPKASISASLGGIRARYASEEEYQADLGRLGLDHIALWQAVERDMVVEAVLEKVGAHAAAVSDTDVEIFWFVHKDRFRRAETRVLRHILITINEQLSANKRPAVRNRIDAIRNRLLKSPERFEEQALKHSECPTAINGGLLGTVPRGQLYLELETAAFALAEGGLSEAVESELGYHLIYCETINPARQLPFEEVHASIREYLEQQRRNICRKSWINALRNREVGKAA